MYFEIADEVDPLHGGPSTQSVGGVLDHVAASVQGIDTPYVIHLDSGSCRRNSATPLSFQRKPPNIRAHWTIGGPSVVMPYFVAMASI